MSSSPPMVLVFAASDPTGGAGLQADLLTIAALGCHPLSVLTAITAQDTRGVDGLLALEPEWVARQARVVLADLPVAAFKIGVLGSARNAEAVAALLAEHPRTPVVLDPVLASGRGDPLSDNETVQVLRSLLLPRTTVLTPNSLEARRLALAAPDAELPQCALELARLGCKRVLITGTHETGAEVTNTLYDAGGMVREDRWPRLAGEHHGSGCTLASALVALLAKGKELEQAVQQAQEFTWKSLAAGFSPGRGQAIPDRFFGSR
ncbi:MAG: hydroxymethylpyrimidine/phosphomethylpyrimidine kinase [Candidatus Parcubacteria bacterium]|nr:hydroxymethylpyrimidine/phosphomethylpyrimidine kinase [Burkholderiales bacterium]